MKNIFFFISFFISISAFSQNNKQQQDETYMGYKYQYTFKMGNGLFYQGNYLMSPQDIFEGGKKNNEITIYDLKNKNRYIIKQIKSQRKYPSYQIVNFENDSLVVRSNTNNQYYLFKIPKKKSEYLNNKTLSIKRIKTTATNVKAQEIYSPLSNKGVWIFKNDKIALQQTVWEIKLYKFDSLYYKQNKDSALFQTAKMINSMQAYKDYIDKSPYDYHKSDAEIAAYRIAQYKNTISTYREYQNLFASSSYVSEASEGINKINQQVAREEEDRIYKNTLNGTISDCENYLNTYSNGRYITEVQNRKQKLLDDKELAIYETAKDGDKDDCIAYLTEYPSGKYVAQVNERLLYLDVKYADKASDFDKYLNKYPSGEYYSDIKNRKKNLTAKLERERKIKANSDIRKWDLGFKICRQDYRGIVMGTIEQWNGSKSRVQIKIAASPGGLTDEGDKLTKGNTIWINPKNGWHLCLDDEKQYALDHDKSDDFEKYVAQGSSSSTNTKKGKFDIGTSVSYKFKTSILGLWTNDYYVKGVVTGWNSDFSKMKIKVSTTNYDDPGDDRLFNGQTFYRGDEIWVSPYGWE